jgi:PIN domain nuclease of toxin-antitoxin system
MKALLDTHALIWFLTDHPHLSKNARELIEGDERPIYLSSVVVAEISIKYARGKLQLPLAPRELVPKLLYDMRLTSLDFTLAHAGRLAELPHHHRDPFDRMLIAQALDERMSVVSVDAIMSRYGVSVIW